MKEPFFVLFVAATCFLAGLSTWPVAERFKVVPAMCLLDEAVYQAVANPR